MIVPFTDFGADDMYVAEAKAVLLQGKPVRFPCPPCQFAAPVVTLALWHARETL